MQNNFFSHLADKDYTYNVQATPIVAYLLKPMGFELRTMRALSVQRRRAHMLELIEQETLEYQRQLAAKNKVFLHSVGCICLRNKISGQRDKMCF